MGLIRAGRKCVAPSGRERLRRSNDYAKVVDTYRRRLSEIDQTQDSIDKRLNDMQGLNHAQG
jgi:hypothetical protein